nr:MAG TPA_asm: hypothetical protein [Bacteriophage sp.]
MVYTDSHQVTAGGFFTHFIAHSQSNSKTSNPITLI